MVISDDQVLLLRALIGASASTVGLVALAWWWWVIR